MTGKSAHPTEVLTLPIAVEGVGSQRATEKFLLCEKYSFGLS